MSLRYIIIEDESYAADRLKFAIDRLRPEWELVATIISVQDSISFFTSDASNCIDLAFMDIQLPDGTCFDIFEQVNLPCPVIFTTAYDTYAIKAFKVNSIDYLLKPLSDAELALSLTRFDARRREIPSKADISALRMSLNTEVADRLLLNCGDTYMHINIKDIAYLLCEDNMVFVYPFTGQRRLTSYVSLTEIASRLPSSRFFQLSRSIISSIDSIESVSKYFRGRLLVKIRSNGNSISVTVPSSRRNDFLTWMGR